ncbi:MAG TPA: hypothetical protein VFB00_03335 [Terriglobales bacterium]|nr:hypothetical protein [Terriglobales bacterium]
MRRKSGTKATKEKLKPIPPTEPAARDEGPRLIPLDDRSKEPSRLEHYLELADTALGRKRLGPQPEHRK